MRATPQKWTHHHIQRLYHISMMACFIFIIFAVIYGVFVAIFIVDAGTISDEGNVSISALVASVSSEPAVVNQNSGSGANSSGFSPNPATYVSVQHKGAKLGQKTINGQIFTTFIHPTQYPAFFGDTNVREARIFLEIISDRIIIRGNTKTDDKGRWSWQTGDPVLTGYHMLKVTAKSPNSHVPDAETAGDLYVDIGTNQPEQPTNKPLTPEFINKSATLFDILVTIPTAFRQIAPGSDMVASVKLINFGSPGKPVDVGVEYIMQNSKGEILIDTTETVAVATQLSLIKTFYTSAQLPDGLYKITVKVPSVNLIATSSDYFQIKNPVPVTALTSEETNKTNPILVYQSLLGLLFMFSLVAYFEYNKVNILSKIIKTVTESDLKMES